MAIDISRSETVSKAINTRVTVRDFLPDPVPEDILLDLLSTARRAPSGGNLQPWRVHVLTGAARDNFVKDCLEKAMRGEVEENTHPAYPSPLWEPQRSWRFKVGEEMYALLGITREDKAARIKWQQNNSRFFNAPVGLIVTSNKACNAPQYLDIGIYLQTLMILARERGLHTAPQGWWRRWPETAAKHINIPDEEEVIVGMGIGYANPDAAVNSLVSERAELEELVHFYK